MNGETNQRPAGPAPRTTRRMSPEAYSDLHWSRDFSLNPDGSTVWEEQWVWIGLASRAVRALEVIAKAVSQPGARSGLRAIEKVLGELAADVADANPKRAERRRKTEAHERLAESRARAQLAYQRSSRPVDPEILTRPLIDTFSARVTNCLEIAGIHSIGELVTKTADDLTSLRHFGTTCLNEVRWKLAERGLTLTDDPAPPPEGSDE